MKADLYLLSEYISTTDISFEDLSSNFSVDNTIWPPSNINISENLKTLQSIDPSSFASYPNLISLTKYSSPIHISISIEELLLYNSSVFPYAIKTNI